MVRLKGFLRRTQCRQCVFGSAEAHLVEVLDRGARQLLEGHAIDVWILDTSLDAQLRESPLHGLIETNFFHFHFGPCQMKKLPTIPKNR